MNMKKKVFLIIILIMVSVSLIGCAGNEINEPTSAPGSASVETEISDEEPVPTSEIPDEDNSFDELSYTYTVEQIQSAMEGRIDGTIVAVEKVEMDRDSITFAEPGEVIYDLWDSATEQEVVNRYSLFKL